MVQSLQGCRELEKGIGARRAHFMRVGGASPSGRGLVRLGGVEVRLDLKAG